jgi:quercetin dioxygenase-like cupin family protein
MRFPSGRRWLASSALALAVAILPVPLSVAAPAQVVQAAVAQPRPTTSSEAWFDVEQPPAVPFEAVQLVVDFPAGARVARHVHGGPGYITMLDGDMTMLIGAGPPRTYGPDESFVEPFRIVAEGANLSAAPASLIVTYLIRVGEAVTTLSPGAGAAPDATLPPGQLPAGAVPRFESRMRLDAAPASYRVGQMLRTYAPGAWTMSEIAPALRLLTVVSGEIQVLTGASERTYKAGETWTELPGTAYLSGNQGTAAAVVAVSVVEFPQ